MQEAGMLDLTKETVVFAEGTHTLIGWKRHDVVAQGVTFAEAWASFQKTVTAQCLIDASEGRLPYQNVPPPPPDVVARWESMKV